jgi:zeaxanthin glucosyltransferase
VGSIVLVTSEMAGRINITCELARRLTLAGHETAISCPVDVRSAVEAQGVRYLDIAPHPPSSPGRPVGVPPGSVLARLRAAAGRLRQVRTIAPRRRARVAALDLGGFVATMRGAAPDLLLIDVELPAHVMAACGAGMPVALWTSMLSLWKRPGLPPLGSGIMVGCGLSGTRAGIELAWMRFRTWKWLRRRRLQITRIGEDQVSVLRAVAADVGFPFRAEVDLDQWLVPCTFRSLPVASFNAIELEFPHDPTPQCTYVGPVVPEGAVRAHPGVDADEVRRTLGELVARRRNGDSAALVYCSFGAWHKGDDRPFLGRILRAVAAHPEWDVVVGLGGRIDLASLGPVPANVHVFSWAPQLEVLAVADCAIHHGGISSVNECITHQVPMVLYPFDFMDQPGNAARVAFHGIGEVGDREGDSAADIERRIGRLLSDRGVRDRIATMSEAFATYQRDDRAVAFVEAALARRAR